MKFSIITIVYNNVNFIEDCIKSVISQTRKDDIEYIIIDNNSTDGTKDIIDRYAGNITKVISEKDSGPFYAMNKGLDLASGDVVGFLHADDLYANNKVIEKVEGLFKGISADSVYGDLVYVKKDKPDDVVRYWKSGKYDRKMIERGWMPPHPTFFVKREVYKKYGVFNTGFTIAADYEIMLRFLYKYEISVSYIPEILVKMRMGGISNRSPKGIIRKTAEDYKACKVHGIKWPAYVIAAKNIMKIPQFFIRGNKENSA